ncbi:MAG: hypothetical protein R6X32_06860 [Chloroflexota bacterium]
MNTPQFAWVKSRLPNKAQPVPPIYQPEIAADAIVWAAHNRRREIAVTFNSVVLMWGNKLFPGLGDWYLSQTGYQSQQTKTPREPDKSFNLWEPVAGDFGARGSFDDEARERSWFLAVNKHLPAISLIGLAVLGTITALLGKNQRR